MRICNNLVSFDLNRAKRPHSKFNKDFQKKDQGSELSKNIQNSI